MSNYRTEAKYIITVAIICACILMLAIVGAAYDLVPEDRFPITYALIVCNILLAGIVFKKPEFVDHALDRFGTFILVLSVAGFVLGWLFYDSMIMRRIFFANMALVALLPAVQPLIAFARPIKDTSKGANKPLARLLLLLILAIIVVPGFVLPPFWDGIPGWKSGKIPEVKEVSISGYKLIRDDGVSVWYSPAVLGTVTYFTGWHRYASQSPGKMAAFEKFLWDNYVKNYPFLEKGISGNQHYLGKYAFPGHTPYRMYDYAAFPPSRIRSIDYVIEKFDVMSGKLIESTSSMSFEVQK